MPSIDWHRSCPADQHLGVTEGKKPPGVSWETWVDKQLADGRAQGLFDDLPGAGKPLPGLDGSRDDLWWLKRKLREENLTVPLPPQLQIRKDVRDFLDSLPHIAAEDAVRDLITNLNHRIREINRTVITGPPTTLMPYDVDGIVDRWRLAREG
jgi:hypothetical protein